MEYKVVLKYTYKYTSSGNYYKEVVREYYHLIKDVEHNSVFGIGYTPTDKKINLKEVNDNNIKFTYSYVRYLYPNTFRKESELVTKEYVLEQGKDLIIDCVDTYWVYARGGENSPASLEIKWIKYEEFMSIILSAVEKDKYNASGVANLLIQEQMYDLAYKILIDSELLSYELGLCYEKGYGTLKDLDKALDVYMNIFAGKHVEKAIERVYLEKYNKKIKYDEVIKTIYFYNKGEYIKAYSNAIIPTEMNGHSLEDLRLNVELDIIYFLELGRPFNDPFSSPTHNMENLATYYDMVNDYPKKTYYEEWEEDDPYDSGTITKSRFYVDEMINTFQREALKNDVIAIAVLLIQHYDRINNHEELENRLIVIANNDDKYKGMANYFLGLYHELVSKESHDMYSHDYSEDKTYTYDGEDIEKDINDYINENNIEYKSVKSLLYKLNDFHLWAKDKKDSIEKKDLENYIIYIYNKVKDKYSKLEIEHKELSIKYFIEAFNNKFYMALPHIALKYKEEKIMTIKEMAKYKKYIPYIKYSMTEKYHDLIK